MNTINLGRPFLAIIAALVLFGCSGKGPDIVDPASGDRNQMALIATDQGSSGELTRYSEISGLITTSDYATSNGGPLGKPIDGLYDSFLRNQIYMLHRAEGSITVLDVLTRHRVDTIAGMYAAEQDGLCGFAVSNYSQAWAVCSGVPKLYEIDTRNYKLARAVDLPGRPTAVGTDSSTQGGYVLIGMVYDDGHARLGVTHSNSTDFRIEQTIDFPSPILYVATTFDGRQVIVLTAGPAGGHPALYFLDAVTLAITSTKELTMSALTQYVGQVPTFVRMDDNGFLYVAGAESVIQVDVQNPGGVPLDYVYGGFRVIAVDRTSGLLYAYAQNGTTVHRFMQDGTELEEVPVTGTVADIMFVNSNELR
jgi:hypothetical protein